MKKIFARSITALTLLLSIAAQAQDSAHMAHRQHTASSDSRQAVAFRPDVREHLLSNMRGHLVAVSEILLAMAQAQYVQAADIADTQLGMSSPAAEGCKSGGDPGAAMMSSPVGNPEHRMQQSMPEAMRGLGLQMHEAATAFAIEARRSDQSGDAKPALAALSQMTQRCTACHAAFAVQ